MQRQDVVITDFTTRPFFFLGDPCTLLQFVTDTPALPTHPQTLREH